MRKLESYIGAASPYGRDKRVLSKCLRVSAIVAIVGAVIAPTATTAQQMTVTFGTPNLIGRVAITVPMTVSCPAFGPSFTMFDTFVNVSVEQAAGANIATGSAFTSGFLPNLQFVCDGSEQAVSITVLANPSGPPFHGGPAVFSASASAEAGTSCGPGCFTNIVTQFATAGPTTIHMH
jgi:hypothetical protein